MVYCISIYSTDGGGGGTGGGSRAAKAGGFSHSCQSALLDSGARRTSCFPSHGHCFKISILLSGRQSCACMHHGRTGAHQTLRRTSRLAAAAATALVATYIFFQREQHIRAHVGHQHADLIALLLDRLVFHRDLRGACGCL